jgi:SAM-dependent methyltransferase
MTARTEHRALIERIRASGDDVRQAMERVSPGKLAASPGHGAWSVLETLVHLRNVVVMVHGLRIRRLLYEARPVFADYDEASHRRAALESGVTADRLVTMIVAEHRQLADLLEELPDDRWCRAGRHPELGEMSIEVLAARVAGHAEEHAAQIRRTVAEVFERARRRARAIAQDSLARGDETGWFERVYATAAADPSAIPWVELRPDRTFLAWARREGLEGQGRTALVVGCGFGDDAEELGRRGFRVVAFDIAPTAVGWCRRRFPGSPVEYVVGDVLAPPSGWRRAFDFVLEVFTLQVLPGPVRARAIDGVAAFVKPGGTLLVVARGREPDEEAGSLPWPLTRDELGRVEDGGLRLVRFEDYLDSEVDPPVRRFRVAYQRPTA